MCISFLGFLCLACSACLNTLIRFNFFSFIFKRTDWESIKKISKEKSKISLKSSFFPTLTSTTTSTSTTSATSLSEASATLSSISQTHYVQSTITKANVLLPRFIKKIEIKNAIDKIAPVAYVDIKKPTLNVCMCVLH